MRDLPCIAGSCERTILDPVVPDDDEREATDALSAQGAARRRFLVETGVLTGGVAIAPPLADAQSSNTSVTTSEASSATRVELEINGKRYDVAVDPRVTLLDLLREHLALTGTKKGCDRGQCGACTVLVNGRRVNACLTLAVSLQGERVVTVEGLAPSGELHPVQRAFIERDAFQCGYCTPGQICSAVALLEEAKRGDASAVTANVRSATPAKMTDDEIRERMSGNLCRCGAYVNIVRAVSDASRT